MRVLSQSCPFNSFLLIQCARVMPLKIFLWCSVLLQATFALTGDNVCRRVETSSETVQYVIQEPVTYRLYTWCLKMPPRCSKYSTIMKERIKSKIQINNNTIEECCEGHVELSGICVTECNSTECPNMLCKTEDSLVKCKCRSGFMGYKCNKPCLYGFWGEGCFDKCECNGESCDAATGDCLKTSPVTTTTTSQTSETPPTTNSKTNGLTSTSSQQKTSNSKIDKNDSSQEAYPDLSLDPTGMPPAVSQEEFPATLLPAPEDEIILLYPSPRAQTPSGLQKLRDTIVSTSSTTESSITSDSIPRPPKSEDTLEKLDDLVRHTLFTKDSEFGSKNENDLTERFPMKSTTDHESNQSTSRFPFNINQNGNTDSTTHSANQKYKYPDEWHKMENKHYQNKNDNDFDNNLQMSNGVQNYTDFNRNGLNTNEIQKDMGAHSEENLSSSDMTINSSLVKAKRQRGFDLLDFNSLLILLSLAATIILSFVLIIVSVVRCNRLKADASSSYDDTVNCENPIRTGHYSTPGQPIFFCPAFTNSYAIELAQELREAQYDHPKSACCLNEPLYAELKY